MQVFWPRASVSTVKEPLLGSIVLLGGTGGVGLELLKKLIEKTENNIIVTVRSRKKLLSSMSIKGLERRVSVVEWEYQDKTSIDQLIKLIQVSLKSNIVGYVNCISEANLVKQDILDTGLDELFLNVQKECSTNLSVIRKLVGSKLLKAGSIVFIGSSAADDLDSDWISYSLSKVLQRRVVKYLAKRLGPLGVRVNEVVPGMIESDLISHLTIKNLAIQK